MIIKLFEFNSPIYVSLNTAIERRVYETITASASIEPSAAFDENTVHSDIPEMLKNVFKLWQYFLHSTRWFHSKKA